MKASIFLAASSPADQTSLRDADRFQFFKVLAGEIVLRDGLLVMLQYRATAEHDSKDHGPTLLQ